MRFLDLLHVASRQHGSVLSPFPVRGGDQHRLLSRVSGVRPAGVCGDDLVEERLFKVRPIWKGTNWVQHWRDGPQVVVRKPLKGVSLGLEVPLGSLPIPSRPARVGDEEGGAPGPSQRRGRVVVLWHDAHVADAMLLQVLDQRWHLLPQHAEQLSGVQNGRLAALRRGRAAEEEDFARTIWRLCELVVERYDLRGRALVGREHAGRHAGSNRRATHVGEVLVAERLHEGAEVRGAREGKAPEQQRSMLREQAVELPAVLLQEHRHVAQTLHAPRRRDDEGKRLPVDAAAFRDAAEVHLRNARRRLLVSGGRRFLWHDAAKQ
mmetsp:Transcript_6750/g.26096  ORF Transcript_6750/g.26096 Transcript_6750/m.26096 type:complete len:321 (-) Transcript_6750:140-1102(-)